MIRVDLAWVAAAVEGKLVGSNLTIEEVSTDTRNLPAGALFIALQGPNFNAHEFVPQAIAKGAAAAIVEQQQNCDCPQIIVNDTRHALGLLGAAVKQQVAPKTIAITGSSGKTTVKEMMAAILGRRGKVLATAGNFNNDIGVPLTLLRLTEAHDYAVLELGANHRGEIAYTSQLVKPNVAIINNVSPAHVEGFGDVHGIAKAKSEIFRGCNQVAWLLRRKNQNLLAAGSGCWQTYVIKPLVVPMPPQCRRITLHWTMPAARLSKSAYQVRPVAVTARTLKFMCQFRASTMYIMLW